MEAKRTGVAVDIPSLTTATETVAANPNGSLTLTQSVYPTRVQRNGTWIPVDTTLHVAADGSLVPAAVPSAVALSGGGDSTPLATLTSVGRKFSLSWPGTLPKPTISGSTATYAEVMPGVDLQATVTPLGGFSDVLVVKNAAAAANPELSALTLKTHGTGLSTSDTADGGLTVTDRTGAAVFAAPTAVMWDSSTQADGSASASGSPAVSPSAVGSPKATPTVQPSASAVAHSSAKGPGFGAHIGKVTAKASQSGLTLTPDTQVLRGGSAHYPVYIDPDLHPVPANDPLSGYDEVQQGCPDKNAYKSTTAPYDTPGVGYNGYSGCIGTERALYQFNVDRRLWNSSAAVIDATFKATEVYSASCSVTSNVNLALITNVGLGTTWNTQPTPGKLQDTQSFGSACSSNPSQGFSVLDAFTKAHNESWSGVALVMTAADESDKLDFRRFSNNPTITVTFNTLPTVFSATTSPETSPIGHTTVTLNAYVTDADKGAGIQAKFTLVGTQGSTTVYPKVSIEPIAQVTERGTVSWRVGYLPTGNYTWTVQADDGDTKHPADVITKTFSVDATAPAPPNITSPDIIPDPSHPDNRLIPPSRTRQLEFDVTPPDTETNPGNIAYYAYSWGTPPPTVNPPLTVGVDPGGNATLHLVPMGFLRDILYVYAVDKAGNESSVNSFAFNTSPPSEKDATGDLTGDGKADLVLPGSDGNIRLYPGSGSGAVTAPVNLWAAGGGAANFSGAHIAVGTFAGNAEQDLLVLTPSGQADIYTGNGDGEPLPWTTMKHDATTGKLALEANLEPPRDPNTNAPIPGAGLQWPGVAQVAAAADDKQPLGTIPGLWLVSKDGGLYWADPSTAAGDFSNPVLINANFQNTEIASAGDVGGCPALWARNTVTGKLTLYVGTVDFKAGEDGGPSGTDIASPAGWGSDSVDSLFSTGDSKLASGVPGLWATDAQAVHTIYYYAASTTSNSLPSRTRVQTLNPNDDFTGDGQADIVAEWGDGTLHLYTGEAGGKLTGSGQIWDSSWSTVKAMVSGDFTGDGRSDVIAIWGDGTVHRYDGTGTGGLNSSVVLFGSKSWDVVRELTAGDFNGDGKTDLVAVWNDGSLHLYTNNGQGTFNAPADLWTDKTWSGMRLLSGSDYNGDGNSDLLAVQTSTGKLQLYVGDGNGHLADAIPEALDWSTIKDIIPGDFTGDGKADLAAIWNDGTLHLYTGSGSGTFSSTGNMWRLNDNSWSTIKLAT